MWNLHHTSFIAFTEDFKKKKNINKRWCKIDNAQFQHRYLQTRKGDKEMEKQEKARLEKK
jgi:uncharacterized protein (UPF0332 family)